jgi:hypothetical protein
MKKNSASCFSAVSMLNIRVPRTTALSGLIFPKYDGQWEDVDHTTATLAAASKSFGLM